MRVHLILDGVVENTVVADSIEEAEGVFPGMIVVDADAGGSVGDAYDAETGVFTPPGQAPAPVPSAVTMRQARLALMGAGMLDSVNGAIAAMTGAQGDAARIEWEFSSEVRRHQPLVLALAPALGLTDVQLDELFVAAAAL
jgi:hypothetical protein